MKKTLCILAVLALAVSANASIRVFATSSADGYGLTIPTNAPVATYSTTDADGNVLSGGLDTYYFAVTAFPPQASPSGTAVAPVLAGAPNFAYIWLEFSGEAAGAKINGLRIDVLNAVTNAVVSPAELSFTYYFLNDKNNTGGYRWDGQCDAGAPQFHTNPQTMVGVQGAGLVNAPTTSIGWNMGKRYVAGEAMYLLGSIQGSATKALTTYKLHIGDISLASGIVPTVGDGFVAMSPLPEPASLLLMGLAGLLIRRR